MVLMAPRSLSPPPLCLGSHSLLQEEVSTQPRDRTLVSWVGRAVLFPPEFSLLNFLSALKSETLRKGLLQSGSLPALYLLCHLF